MGSMKINICMLLGPRYDHNVEFPPDIGIPSYITNFGHAVTWILSSEEIKEFRETTSDDIRIFIVPCRYRAGIFKPITKLLYGFRRVNFLFRHFKQEKYNMIFIRETGLLDGLLGLYLKRRYKIPLVHEKTNQIEQDWETRKYYSKHKYIWYFISKIEAHLTRYLLNKADLVLAIGRFMYDYLSKEGIERSKILNLPQGANVSRFLGENGEMVRKKYGLEDSKVVIYVGTMDKPRHLDALMRSFSEIKESRDNVKFLMVGDGTDKSNLERLSNDLGLEADVNFTGKVYFHEVPNFIAASDIGVSPIPPLDFYKVSCPIKMIEYMAMGKPVVANEEIPEQKVVISETGGGLLVRFEDKSLANGIINLLDNPERAIEMGEKGREWVIKNRTYDILARRLEDRYFEIL